MENSSCFLIEKGITVIELIDVCSIYQLNQNYQVVKKGVASKNASCKIKKVATKKCTVVMVRKNLMTILAELLHYFLGFGRRRNYWAIKFLQN